MSGEPHPSPQGGTQADTLGSPEQACAKGADLQILFGPSPGNFVSSSWEMIQAKRAYDLWRIIKKVSWSFPLPWHRGD